MLLKIVACSVAFAAIYFGPNAMQLYYSNIQAPGSSGSDREIPKTKGPAEIAFMNLDGYLSRIDWAEFDSMSEIVKLREPMVLTNTPAEAWGLRSIDWDGVRQELPLLKSVRAQDEPLFVLRNEKWEKKGLVSLTEPSFTEAAFKHKLELLDELPLDVFLETANDPDQYLYCTVGLDDVSKNVASSVDLSPLTLDEPEAVESDLEQAHVGLLWLSHPGVTSQTHYDVSHNMFVQLLGRKRFYVFPPSDAQALRLFPALHPSYRQSQLDWSNATQLSAEPLYHQIGAFQADLGPGDVLYIPPFWLHRVESQTLSLSLSVLSPSREEVVFGQAYWAALPFSSMENIMQRSVAAQLLLFDLLYWAGEENVSEFALALYTSRYSKMYPPSSPFLLQNNFHCYRGEEHDADMLLLRESTFRMADTLRAASRIARHARVAAGLPPTVEEEEAALRSGTRQNQQQGGDGRGGEEVEEQQIDMGVLQARAVLRTWLSDYVEELARWAMGVDHSVLFILECLAHSGGGGDAAVDAAAAASGSSSGSSSSNDDDDGSSSTGGSEGSSGGEGGSDEPSAAAQRRPRRRRDRGPRIVSGEEGQAALSRAWAQIEAEDAMSEQQQVEGKEGMEHFNVLPTLKVDFDLEVPGVSVPLHD